METIYCVAEVCDITVFVELTQRQIYGAEDCWNENRVDVFEDRDGHVVPYWDVLICDLENIRPEHPSGQ